jgi:mono/diheme cytochrome c family protein
MLPLLRRVRRRPRALGMRPGTGESLPAPWHSAQQRLPPALALAILGCPTEEAVSAAREVKCWTLAAACVAAAWACSGDDASLSPLAQEGRRIYRNVCIACHNGDPTRDGSLGPAIAGSARELLEAKLLRGEYPPGYTPKRPTAAMPRFESLADRLDALAAYLAQAGS